MSRTPDRILWARRLDEVYAIVEQRWALGLATTGRDLRDVLLIGNQTAHDRLRRLAALGRVRKLRSGRWPVASAAYVPVMP